MKKKERVFPIPAEHSLYVDCTHGLVGLRGRSKKPNEAKIYSVGEGKHPKGMLLFNRLANGEAVEFNTAMVSNLLWIQTILDLIREEHGASFKIGKLSNGEKVYINLYQDLDFQPKRRVRRPHSR